MVDREDIVCLIAVRDEEKYLPGFLYHLRDYVSGVIAFDDSSTDDTYEILKNSPIVLKILRRQDNSPYFSHGVENRKALIQAAIELGKKWALVADADMRFEKRFLEELPNVCSRAEEENVECVNIFRKYLWNGFDQYRANGIYANALLTVLFKLPRELQSYYPEASLHVPWAPPEQCAKSKLYDFNVYDLSNLTREIRVDRYRKFRAVDPDNKQQPIGYKHLIDENAVVEKIPRGREYELGPLDETLDFAFDVVLKRKVFMKKDTVSRAFYSKIVENNAEYKLPETLSEFDYIVDVGAHIGLFTLACLRRQAKKILCFEPNPENYKFLKKNVGGYPEVELYNLAVWDTETTVKVSSPSKTPRARVEKDGHEVSTTTLDKILEKLEGKILLKLDCEGSEYRILSSSKLLDKVDEILLEWHGGSSLNDLLRTQSWTLSYDEKGVTQFLEAKGFKVSVLSCYRGQQEMSGVVRARRNKIALACLAHNRPHYAKPSVESILRARKPKDLKIFVQIDAPDETKDEIVKLYKQLGDVEFLYSNVGSPDAALLLLREVFSRGYDLCFYIAEDIIVSEDLFEFCLDALEKEPEVVAVSEMSVCRSRDDDRLYRLDLHWSPAGSCLKRDFFVKYIDPLIDEYFQSRLRPDAFRKFAETHKLIPHTGWDLLVFSVIQREKKLVVVPFSDRAKHIGSSGTHVKGPLVVKSLEEWAQERDTELYKVISVNTYFGYNFKLRRERQSLKRAVCVLLGPLPVTCRDGLRRQLTQRYKELDSDEFHPRVIDYTEQVARALDCSLVKHSSERVDIDYVYLPATSMRGVKISVNARVRVFELIAETPYLTERDKHFLQTRIAKEFDFLITPSSFFKSVLEQFHRNVHFVPASIPTELLEDVEPVPTLNTEGRFVFLCIVTPQSRKNIPVLIQSFGTAFKNRDDVCLVLRSSFSPGVLARYKKYTLPKIYFCNRELSRKQLNWLYRNAHAYVTASRGEGLNIPLLEAMYFELPVIAGYYTAHTDYMTEENSFPVRDRGMKPAIAYDGFSATHIGYELYQIDESDLIDKMRYVFNHYSEAREKGKKAKQTVLEKYHINVTRKQLLDVLRKYV